MSRENKRQIARLRRLASEVLTNPEYNQVNTDNCIVGLGNRLTNGKIGPIVENDWSYATDEIRAFAKKFGLKFETAYSIFYGYFNEINRKAKNWKIGEVIRFTPLNDSNMRRSAASILEFVAKRKEQGLPV